MTRKCPYCQEVISTEDWQIHFVAEAIWALEETIRKRIPILKKEASR